MEGKVITPKAFLPGDFLVRIDRGNGFMIPIVNQVLAVALDRPIRVDRFGYTLDSGSGATAMTAISGTFKLGTLDDDDYFASFTIANNTAAGYVAGTDNARVAWVSDAIKNGARVLNPGQALVLNYTGLSASTAGCTFWAWCYPVGFPDRT